MACGHCVLGISVQTGVHSIGVCCAVHAMACIRRRYGRAHVTLHWVCLECHIIISAIIIIVLLIILSYLCIHQPSFPTQCCAVCFCSARCRYTPLYIMQFSLRYCLLFTTCLASTTQQRGSTAMLGMLERSQRSLQTQKGHNSQVCVGCHKGGGGCRGGRGGGGRGYVAGGHGQEHHRSTCVTCSD